MIDQHLPQSTPDIVDRVSKAVTRHRKPLYLQLDSRLDSGVALPARMSAALDIREALKQYEFGWKGPTHGVTDCKESTLELCGAGKSFTPPHVDKTKARNISFARCQVCSYPACKASMMLTSLAWLNSARCTRLHYTSECIHI